MRDFEKWPQDLIARIRKCIIDSDGSTTVYFDSPRTGMRSEVVKAPPKQEEPLPEEHPEIAGDDEHEEPDHEIPSQLFDGLFFSESAKTIRYGTKVARLRNLELKLLMLLDDNDGTLDLGYAATECWGKPYEDDDVSADDNGSVSYETIKVTFYRLKKAIGQVGLPAVITLSQANRQIKLESNTEVHGGT